MGSFKTDEDPLKACAILPSEKENDYFCLSGGLGELLQVNLIHVSNEGIRE